MNAITTEIYQLSVFNRGVLSAISDRFDNTQSQLANHNISARFMHYDTRFNKATG